MLKPILTYLLLILFSIYSGQLLSQPLQPSTIYPQYWEYKGKPILLLGGSDEDNLFQMEGLREQLDTLAMVGGNYVRCTMSSRDEGNVWPFYFDEEKGSYDLTKWNEEYWTRFANFLKWTHEREIFVQVEIWATFDFYRDNWAVNPFNPGNNSNYGFERSELPDTVATHPIFADNNFFTSIPSHRNNTVVLNFQQKFVDNLLSLSLEYDHVLYCMDNETSVTASWGAFWADYIRKIAREEGKDVYCTEMWDPWDLNHIMHRESFDHPEIYGFVEISQNNHHTGQTHWDNGLAQIERLKKLDNLRPVTNVKIYGADGGQHGGGGKDAMEKFCRAILFGSSSARFHRPTSGLGLNQDARNVIKSIRMATYEVKFFEMQPLDGLKGRAENEAYLRGIPDHQYMVFFTDGGGVGIETPGDWEVKWLKVDGSSWITTEKARRSDTDIVLTCPESGLWIALVNRL